MKYRYHCKAIQYLFRLQASNIMVLIVRKDLFSENQNYVHDQNIQENAKTTFNDQEQSRETFNTAQVLKDRLEIKSKIRGIIRKYKTTQNYFVNHQEMREETAWKQSLCLELVEEYLQ